MKKRLLATLLGSLFVLSAPVSALAGDVYVASCDVHIRALGDVDSTAIGYVKGGDTVTILEKTNGYWYKVNYNGKVGYVSTLFINETDLSSSDIVVTTLESGQKAVNVPYLNVRSNASATAPVIGVIKQGDIVNVTDNVWGWDKIQINNLVGYSDQAFLTENFEVVEYVTTEVNNTIPVQNVVAPAGSVTKVVNTEFVNVRGQAAANSAVVGLLKKGDVVIVSDDVYGWNKVELGDGKTGYVDGRFLSIN